MKLPKIIFHQKSLKKNNVHNLHIDKDKHTCEITKQKTTLNGKLFNFFNMTKIIHSCKKKIKSKLYNTTQITIIY